MGKALSRNQASYAAPDAIAIAMESLNTLAARLVDAGLKESEIAHFKYLKTSPILNKLFPKSQRRMAQPPLLNSLVFSVSHLTKPFKHQILSFA
jgi:hypothetical protein